MTNDTADALAKLFNNVGGEKDHAHNTALQAALRSDLVRIILQAQIEFLLENPTTEDPKP